MNSQYPLEKFKETGFSVVNMNKEDIDISAFTKNWIKFLLGNQAAKNPTNIHEIIKDDNFYSTRLIQKNRHRDEKEFIKKIIEKYKISSFIERYWSSKWKIWDEGFGSLGIRIVRPNSNDGYSWSCKYWGPAKNVLSFSLVQFIGCPNSATTLIPYTHKLINIPYKYENSIHCKDELRLDEENFDTSKSIKPANSQGDLLITHPKLIHTEKNYSNKDTRISLEFRLTK